MEINLETLRMEQITIKYKFDWEYMIGSIIFSTICALVISIISYVIFRSTRLVLTAATIWFIVGVLSCYYNKDEKLEPGEYYKIKARIRDNDIIPEIYNREIKDLNADNYNKLSEYIIPHATNFTIIKNQLYVENYIKVSDYENIGGLDKFQKKFEEITNYEYNLRKDYILLNKIKKSIDKKNKTEMKIFAYRKLGYNKNKK